MALLTEVLEDAGLLHFPLELLECPIEAICFVEYNFNHLTLGEWVDETVETQEPDRLRSARLPNYVGKCVPTASLAPDLGDVLGRGALGTLNDVELNSLSLGQSAEAAALNCRVVNEAILLTAFGGDEAKALRVVE